MRIAVIGAGVAGLAAAHTLVKDGHQVVVYEAADFAGGLASGFRDERWEWALDRFYHHWFTSDDAVIKLIDEIGQSDKLFFPRPITSIWHKGKAYPFDNYLRAMLYPHMSILDKLRAGPVAIYLRMARNWRHLEQFTAHDWLKRWMGENGYRALFEPLLVGKFGEYYQEVNMAWFWARIHKRSYNLGYFVGGFQAFVDSLVDNLRQHGVEIRLGARVSGIRPLETDASDAAVGPRFTLDFEDGSSSSDMSYDRVIVTLSPGLLTRLVPGLPDDYLAGLKSLRSMGATVLILALKHPLTDGHYWINLPKDEGFPFLALVEHTNFIDAKHYGGDHLVYCGDYLKPDHENFDLTKEQMLVRFLPSLQRFNPEVTSDWVRRSWMYREKYAQPVPGINHSRNIPDFATPIPGLYWASMSQVYPWDRGTNYAVELGQEVARRAANIDQGWVEQSL